MHDESDKILNGKVATITGFGAFILLEDGRTGLVHISEVAREYVKDIKDHLQEGQSVKVIIVSNVNGKIALSIKKAMNSAPKEIKSNKPADISFGRDNNNSLTFEDRLSRFMKDSEEKIHDLKKNFESKRGTGYKRYLNS